MITRFGSRDDKLGWILEGPVGLFSNAYELVYYHGSNLLGIVSVLHSNAIFICHIFYLYELIFISTMLSY